MTPLGLMSINDDWLGNSICRKTLSVTQILAYGPPPGASDDVSNTSFKLSEDDSVMGFQSMGSTCRPPAPRSLFPPLKMVPGRAW